MAGPPDSTARTHGDRTVAYCSVPQTIDTHRSRDKGPSMNADNHTVHPIRETLENRAGQLRQDLQLMKDYLIMCVRKEDWHGVMDASADIREIVAKLSMIH